MESGLYEPSAGFAEELLPSKDPERKQQHGGIKKVTVDLNLPLRPGSFRTFRPSPCPRPPFPAPLTTPSGPAERPGGAPPGARSRLRPSRGLRPRAQSNQHNSVQQLDRQQQPRGGPGRWVRRPGQGSGQRCGGSVEPGHRAELSGGPGHLPALRTAQDHPVR